MTLPLTHIHTSWTGLTFMRNWLVAHCSLTTTCSQRLDSAVLFIQRNRCHLTLRRNESQRWQMKPAFTVRNTLRHTAFVGVGRNTASCLLQLARDGHWLGFDGGGDGRKENMYVFYPSFIVADFTYIVSTIHWSSIFWTNCTLTKAIIAMLWTRLILRISWSDTLESREKLTPCIPWSFEVAWRNYNCRMKHIKNG